MEVPLLGTAEDEASESMVLPGERLSLLRLAVRRSAKSHINSLNKYISMPIFSFLPFFTAWTSQGINAFQFANACWLSRQAVFHSFFWFLVILVD